VRLVAILGGYLYRNHDHRRAISWCGMVTPPSPPCVWPTNSEAASNN